MNQETATRATLSPEWVASRQKLDWMHAPEMANYVNKLVSGRDLNDGGHWAVWANDQFVEPLSRKLGRKLSLVSLASGAGHIEKSLIDFGWPLKRLTGLEYDEELRAQAQRYFKDIENVESEFTFFDFNSPFTPTEKFDIVFTCHSIHHATDLELLLKTMNELVNDDGLIIGIDFFGPTRFQVEYDVKPIIDELDQILPPELRRDLRTENDDSPNRIAYATIEEVRTADISESVHSSDLRTLLFSNFPVINVEPMGGTLLRWLLQYRAGNFDPRNNSHVAIAKLLAFIERSLIENRVIRSDDLFFVLTKSDRL